MAHKRTIEIRQINVAMHQPHSPQGYIDLFQKAYRMKLIHVRGRADGFMLGAVYDAKNALLKDELHGEIYRFTNIDPDSPWFNTQTGKPAEESETENIEIPAHLHPNLDRMPFVFLPKSHQLWYVSKDRKASMGPLVAENFFQALFNATCIKHGLPMVEVTVVPDLAAVDEVLNIHRLTRVTMVFKRPNDDADEIEKRVMELMTRRKLNRIEEVMTSQDHEGIKPDTLMVDEAKAAAKNGYVLSEGFDVEGLPARESTIAKPALYSQSVNEEIESIAHVLSRISRE